MEEPTENPERNVQRRQYLVEKLRDSYDENPSEQTKAKLDREVDFLRQLQNAEKGEAKKRAQTKAEYVRKTLLNRAIQQVDL